MEFSQGREFALSLDSADVLAAVREEFYTSPGQLYMDGNSLGLCSKGAERAVLRALEDWKKHGIGIWTGAQTDYFAYHAVIGRKLARLINAKDDEVTVCASTTMNIHQCIATFWQPTEERYRIIVDELNFPTDIYAVKSEIELRGRDVADTLKIIRSADGKTLSEEAVTAAMTPDVALILLPSVLYRSAQLLDMKLLTEAAHERGIIIGFDLCHSIGSVDHDFADIDCDFAVWCNYKYLSGGPGATAGMYVNRRRFDRAPALTGWWGNRSDTRFELREDFEAERGAAGFQTGTSPVLSMAAIDGALEVYEKLSMKAVREKSLLLTDYLMYLIDTRLEGLGFTIGNPREASRRGGHVSLEHDDAVRINEALKAAGVVPDFRYPNVIRLAPVALYTRFADVYDLVSTILEIMQTGAYEKYDGAPGPVA